MENLIVSYFLVGAIVSVITAITQDSLERNGHMTVSNEGVSTVPAYVLIATVWPLAVAITVYSLINLIGQSSR